MQASPGNCGSGSNDPTGKKILSRLMRSLSHAARIRSPHSAVILFQIDGALNQKKDEHSPVGNRDARYVLNITGSWEQAADDAANVQWARDAWSDMKSFSTGR